MRACNVLESTLYSTMGENFERWLLQNFYKSNEEYRKEILEHIENYITQYTNRI